MSRQTHTHALTLRGEIPTGRPVFSLLLSVSVLELPPSCPAVSTSVSPVRSSLIRNSPAVRACVCLSPYKRLYEFLSAGTPHPVSPISLKAVSLLFRFPPHVCLYNTSRRDTNRHISNHWRLVCTHTACRLVLWCSCVVDRGDCLVVC